MNRRGKLLIRWATIVVAAAGVAMSTVAWAQHGRHAKPGAAPSAAAPDVAMRAPDPPAVRSSDQFVLTLKYEGGKATVVKVRKVQLAQPRVTPRNTGRFAIEFLSGHTLVERVRFDFPLMGADELAGMPRQYNAPPRFENRAVVTHDVMVPDSPRFARARLVDRATQRITPIAWPPETDVDAGATAQGGRSDGGTAADAGDAAPDALQRDAAAARDARGPLPDASPL
jgi:hypothetical protein